MSAAAREAIKASFLKLLEERPLREITVKDIVRDCGVNRNSFYYHFKGIPEMLVEIVMEYSARIIAEQGPTPTLAGCLEAAAGFALEHRQAMLHINQSAHRELFEQWRPLPDLAPGGPGCAGAVLSVRAVRPGSGMAECGNAL